MILQALVQLYEALAEEGKVPRAGWSLTKVSYGLDVDREGQLKEIIPLLQEEERGKKKVWVPSVLKVPEMVSRSSGVSANFLCDNSKYMLGVDETGTNQRVQECFKAARDRHEEILREVHNPMADAIKKFFASWNPETAREHPVLREYWDEVTAGSNLIFTMGMDYAQNDPEIQRAWEQKRGTGTDQNEGICLVTGKRTEIARIHNTIKGVQGAQSSGAALVSFNAPAFESYGKEQSYNAPVGKYAAFAYTTALNYLLSQKKYVFTIGDTAVVFWSEKAEEIYQWAYYESLEPTLDNQETIKGVFEKLQKGKAVDMDDVRLDPDERFYILGLAPNAARLSVRFFYQDSFGNILMHLREHYNRMQVVRPIWDKREYLGIWSMLQETVNKNSRDKKAVPSMAASVLRSVISGGRYPESLYSSTLIRIRAEQGTDKITRGRAGILKAYLIRNYNLKDEKEEVFVGLNESCNDTAYVLGREFAVLETIQAVANPGINATIKDRYFNSACATPASVFPVLLKLKNSHIRKISEANRCIFYEKLLTDLQGRLERYPARLRLEEQGLFILGYYHQMQKRYEKKEEV